MHVSKSSGPLCKFTADAEWQGPRRCAGLHVDAWTALSMMLLLPCCFEAFPRGSMPGDAACRRAATGGG